MPPVSEKKEDTLEKVFEAPARALEDGIVATERAKRVVISKKPFKLAEEYWETLGPGLTTGAADDDPSGIATYSEAGAHYGLGLIWLTLFMYPLMSVVQEMCARIGMVSGEGLAANIRRHYSIRVLYLVTILLFAANAFNIAADLGAMSAAARLLVPAVPAWVLVVGFAFVSLMLQVFTTYARYAKYLKYLALSLFSYVAVALAANLDWGAVLHHLFIPSLSFTRDQMFLVCAILGTTISPYLFFWQTSQEVEEGILHGNESVAARQSSITGGDLRRMRIDVWSGMFFSDFITFAIFAACAGTLYASGVTHIGTAAEAAAALKPFGQFAYLLFALGLISTGLLAVPVLAGSSAYAIAESFEWEYGLYRKLNQAYAFYGVIIVAMVVGIFADLIGLDPIKGLIFAALANGLISPVMLFFIVRLSGNKEVMREHANRRLTAYIGWFTIVAMALSGVVAVVSLV